LQTSTWSISAINASACFSRGKVEARETMAEQTPRLPTPHLGPPIRGEDHIASPIPFGWGHEKSHHILQIGSAIRENRHRLGYAWRILTHGVCDGCDMGSNGLSDESLRGIHWCGERLHRLRLNTQSAIPASALSNIHALRTLRSSELRTLGRLPFPMVYRPGDRGFTRLSWDDALDLVGEKLRQTPPERQAWFAAPGGQTNEAFYNFSKAARAAGTHNIDLCVQGSHEQLIAGLRRQTGINSSTCSIEDMVGTDLILLFGDRIAHQPASTLKALAQAKKRGTRIVVIAPSIGPSLERSWIPSLPQSALFGTRLLDDAVYVQSGGEIAFIQGIIKHVLALGAHNSAYIDAHTNDWATFKTSVQETRWEELEHRSGTRRRDMEWVGEMYARAKRCVSVYSTDFTQLGHGEENVAAVVNLHLTRGMIGREHCGIIPLHSKPGIFGATIAGINPNRLPNGQTVGRKGCVQLSAQWEFPLSATPGLTTPDMIRSCARGATDFVYSMGANLFQTLPQREMVEQALEKVSMRVHQGIALDTSMLTEPHEAVVLLPSTTRYEQAGGGTVTTTDRHICFSPQVGSPKHDVEIRESWRIPGQIVSRSTPEMAHAFAHEHSHAIRHEMGKVVPGFFGIESLVKPGDTTQPGGPSLGGGGFIHRPDGRAQFACIQSPAPVAKVGEWTLTTRTHQDPSQFGGGRDELYIHPIDIAKMGLADGDRVQIISTHGTWHAHLRAHSIHPGVVQAHWPSCHAVLAPSTEVLEYTAAVTIEAV
jgi:molybdopterin-dependent oxidoreductase alpha subunit